MATPDDRIADLERRLSALEERMAPAASADAEEPAPPTAPLDEAFWLLDALTRRSGEHGQGAVAYGGTLADGSVQWQYERPADHVMGLDFTDSAAQLAAIGSPVRLRILQGVLDGAGSVSSLSVLPDMGSTGQLYHHLHQLSAAGWLIPRKRGHWEVPTERVIPLLTIILATQS